MEVRRGYKPIKQKPYCCVPACISMVLDRRQIAHKSQEEIGYELGLIVPKRVRRLFKRVRVGKRPSSGFGTRVGQKRYSINSYFSKNKIPLKESYFPISGIKECGGLIGKNLKEGNDVLVCFNNKRLFGEGDWGHVCLIEKISSDAVTLMNPQDAKRKTVNLRELIGAIKYHGRRNRGGFWIISSW